MLRSFHRFPENTWSAQLSFTAQRRSWMLKPSARALWLASALATTSPMACMACPLRHTHTYTFWREPLILCIVAVKCGKVPCRLWMQRTSARALWHASTSATMCPTAYMASTPTHSTAPSLLLTRSRCGHRLGTGPSEQAMRSWLLCCSFPATGWNRPAHSIA